MPSEMRSDVIRVVGHDVRLSGIRDSELVGRPSFWQLQQTRRARERGLPIHLVVHEDVLVLSKGGAHR